ncbi:MAG TPA: hypothetical protein VFB21_16170 [Chthonomonadaceae bacterium]|nr:hypothetical protein [Chthonomonadaceae bacterium]
MAQRAGRVTCPRCGANNFDNVAVCWKCSAPLQAAGGHSGYAAPPAMERPYAAPAAYAPMMPDGDPAVAKRAAIALALVFPWLGLPIGWAFMMVEDRRKQAIGRFCAVWSAVALFFHFLLMYALTASAISMLRQVLPSVSGAMRGAGQGGGGGLGGGLGDGFPGGRFPGGSDSP